MSVRNWETCGILPALLFRAAEIRRKGRPVMACLVTERRGSAPQTPGALMLVDDSGATFGTIGGGAVEAQVRDRALELLAEGGSELRTVNLVAESEDPDGAICGGAMVVAIAPLPQSDLLDRICDDVAHRRTAALHLEVDTEQGRARIARRLPPRDRLYIAGAGHIGRALARLTLDLDFQTTVYDDRPEALRHDLPFGVETACGNPAECLSKADFDERTYCVIVTRGHLHDELALEAVLDRTSAYVGMIGSRRKISSIFGSLAARGASREALNRVHAPIGLDIGAVTVAEIALAIAAQLVSMRRSETLPLVTGPEFVPNAAC